MPRISAEEIADLCRAELPWVGEMGMVVESLRRHGATVRLPCAPRLLRPGGTVGGPFLMGLADFAMYVAVLSAIGRVELAVTTSLTCNFLRRPPAVDVIAEATLIKLGRRLAYGEVHLFSAGARDAGPVAHVTATYSIPPGGPDRRTP